MFEAYNSGNQGKIIGGAVTSNHGIKENQSQIIGNENKYLQIKTKKLKSMKEIRHRQNHRKRAYRSILE